MTLKLATELSFWLVGYIKLENYINIQLLTNWSKMFKYQIIGPALYYK